MPHPFTYIDLEGQTRRTTFAKVFEAAARVRAFYDAIDERYVERGDLLRIVKCAQLMREHALVIGPTGSAKTDVVKAIYGGIQGAKVWAKKMTRFTTETHLFGGFDKRRMDDTGHLWHMTEGTLAEANLALIDEFFDASDHTLRALLGVLNERVTHNGPQQMDHPLLAAVACTNFRPEDMPSRAAMLTAVVDRFLFVHEVEYVQEPTNRLRMLSLFLDGVRHKPLPPLSLSDLELVSGVVVGSNPDLFSDHYVREAYQELTYNYCKGRGEDRWLSDRRYVKAAQMVEVNAILNGRRTATFDDLWAVEPLIVSSMEDLDLLQRIRKESVEKWVAKAARREIDRETEALNVIRKKIPANVDWSKLSTPEVDNALEQLAALQTELEGFEAETIEVQQMVTQGMIALHRLNEAADNRILDIAEAAIPADIDKVPEQAIKGVRDQLVVIEKRLSEVVPRGEAAIVRMARIRDNLLHAKTALELRFLGTPTA